MGRAARATTEVVPCRRRRSRGSPTPKPTPFSCSTACIAVGARAINTVEPDELTNSFDRLQLPEIKRRLAALARKGLVETPTGYEPGKAYFLKPELEDAWNQWMRGQRGFEKIEEFKSRG